MKVRLEVWESHDCSLWEGHWTVNVVPSWHAQKLFVRMKYQGTTFASFAIYVYIIWSKLNIKAQHLQGFAIYIYIWAAYHNIMLLYSSSCENYIIRSKLWGQNRQ